MKDIYETIRILSHYKAYLTEIFIAGIVLSLLQIPLPFFLKVLVDSAYPSKDISLAGIVLVTVFGLTVGRQVLGALRSYIQINVSTAMSYNSRIDFYKHLLSLPHSFISKRQVGELLSRFSDLDASLTGVTGLLFGVVTHTLSLIIFPGILLLINWKLALLAIAFLPFDGYVYYRANKYLKKYARINAQKNADLYGSMNEGLTGYLTIKALNLRNAIIDLYSRELASLRKTVVRSDAIQTLSGVVVAALRSLGTLCYSYYGWRLVISGELTLGSFLAFTGYIGYLYGPIRGLMSMSQQLQVTLVHTERFVEIRNEPQDPSGVVADTGEEAVLPLVARELSFSYATSGPVFTDLSLDFPPHTTTYITGKSGSGKTTLACLLSGITKPTTGRILLGERSLQDYSPDAITRCVGLVLQEPFIFKGSITYNITSGSEDLTEENVRRVTDLVCLTDEIEAMPSQYDSILGEKGSNLSTGQKQRIALARVLIRKPKILLMDEALSAVDMERRHAIWKSICRATHKSTLIYITHDMAATEGSERVVEIVARNKVICRY